MRTQAGIEEERKTLAVMCTVAEAEFAALERAGKDNLGPYKTLMACHAVLSFISWLNGYHEARVSDLLRVLEFNDKKLGEGIPLEDVVAFTMSKITELEKGKKGEKTDDNG